MAHENVVSRMCGGAPVKPVIMIFGIFFADINPAKVYVNHLKGYGLTKGLFRPFGVTLMNCLLL